MQYGSWIRIAFVGLFGLAFPTVSSPQVTICPGSELSTGGEPTFWTTSWGQMGGGDYYAAFDNTLGSSEVRHGGGLSTVYARGVDCFRLLGDRPDDTLTVELRLVVDGYAQSNGCGGSGCYGRLGAVLDVEGQQITREAVARYEGREYFTDPLVLPYQFTLGQYTRITYEIYFRRDAGGNHEGQGVATLQFVNLPDGIHLSSLRGYAVAPVPVRNTTWGRLKTMYRR